MTSEQFEELKAIQDAYLEMRSKEQVIEEPLDEMDLSSIKGAKPRGSVEDQKKARAEMIAKRDAEKPKSDTKTDVKVDTSRGYGKGRYMGDSVEETEEVLESERSKKFKEIGASLDRMMAKAAANTELQKLQKQNKEHKKLPEEVEEVEEVFVPASRTDNIADSQKDKLRAIADLINKERAKKPLSAKVQEEIELDEKELTDIDVKQKEKIVKGMKKNLQAFKDKYGEKAKGVMYATATKIAQKMPDVKEEVEELEELSKATLGSYVDKSRHDLYNKQIQYRNTGDMPERKKLQDKATKRGSGISKAVGKLTKEEVELEEGNFEKNMDIIKSGKLPPHIQAILDKRGAKGNDAIMAKGRAEKLKNMKEILDEARAKKEPAQVYHPTYSSAVQHARANAEKQGYTVSDDDWFHHVNSGPGKPSGGKTTRHVIPLQKDGKPTKKALAIQVHDRQTDKNSYELNSYIN